MLESREGWEVMRSVRGFGFWEEVLKQGKKCGIFVGEGEPGKSEGQGI